MDGTTNQNSNPPIQTPSVAPVQAATPPAPIPPSPQPPTPPAPTPPLQTSPKSPFPLKWALVGIGLIVVLAGSILGILATSNRQTAYTTETKAANIKTDPEPTGTAWPFAALPNVMIEKGTLEPIVDTSGITTDIYGHIIFAKVLNSRAEKWIVWASLDDRGKNRVGKTFPQGNDNLGGPKGDTFPNPGTFTADATYPAVGVRKNGPLPNENHGVLKNGSGEKDKERDEIDVQRHSFLIKDLKFPLGTCDIYLNYRSNIQGGNSTGKNSPMFYKVRLPGCPPLITPAVPDNTTPGMPTGKLPSKTPTPSLTRAPSPTPEVVNLPPGCSLIAKYEAGNGVRNGGTCDETCGLTKNNQMCNPSGQTAYYCTKQSCRPGTNNPYIPALKGHSTYGNWYCCTSACGKTCSTALNCGEGFDCKDNKCVDKANCSQSAGGCKCTVYPIAEPSITPSR